MSDSPWLVDFAIGLVNSVINLPNGQVKFFFKNSKYCDAAILGGNFPSNRACRVAQQIKQAKNRTTGQDTLFMHIAS